MTNANGGVEFNGIRISNAKRTMIINKIYKNKLVLISQKNNISETEIPRETKNNLKQKINESVNNNLIKKENTENQQISIKINNIKKHAKHQLNNSFTNVYKIMIIIPLLSLLIIPIFKFKITND